MKKLFLTSIMKLFNVFKKNVNNLTKCIKPKRKHSLLFLDHQTFSIGQFKVIQYKMPHNLQHSNQTRLSLSSFQRKECSRFCKKKDLKIVKNEPDSRRLQSDIIFPVKM